MTALRRIAQALAIPVVLLLAVTLQLAVVNRAPLPGAAAPDLVLLAVAALAVCAGPMTGMLAGFCGGLALDIAPPAAHLAGEYALVFCLVGYACGRARNAIIYATGEQTMVTSLTVMALGVAAGEAGKAALGMMLSNPDVTSPAIKHVLPVAIVYDLLLCPFAYWLISLMLRRPAPERAPRPEFAQVATAFRAASAGALGAVPSLRLAGSTPAAARPLARQEPKLRLSAGRPSSLSGTSAAFSPTKPPHVSGRAVKLNFAEHAAGTAASRPRQRTSPGKGWLRARPAAGSPVLKHRPPPKGWLRRPARGRGVLAPQVAGQGLAARGAAGGDAGHAVGVAAQGLAARREVRAPCRNGRAQPQVARQRLAAPGQAGAAGAAQEAGQGLAPACQASKAELVRQVAEQPVGAP